MKIEFDVHKRIYKTTITIDGISYEIEYDPRNGIIKINGERISVDDIHSLDEPLRKVCEEFFKAYNREKRPLPSVADAMKEKQDEDQKDD